MSESRVDLGFVEKTEEHLLKSNYFPSKIGGKPSWLSLKDLPSTEQLQCKVCSKPMIFLCQIYAPFEEKETCFHRTLFVFICRNENCCIQNENKNVVVFRSQLNRKNEFYSYDPPVEDKKEEFNTEKYVQICAVCGSSSNKHCSKCKIVSYCSREHQIIDWKAGHKLNCGQNMQVSFKNQCLFEEFEMVIEEEDTTNKEQNNKIEEANLKNYEELAATNKLGTLSNIPVEELELHASVDEDKIFSRFRKRIQTNPDQVLRYNRGGDPLWITKDPKPKEIPYCEYCGSVRQFEFQILPQILYSLHETKIDFGILAIYTCKESCDDGPVYKKEFVFKQDISK